MQSILGKFVKFVTRKFVQKRLHDYILNGCKPIHINLYLNHPTIEKESVVCPETSEKFVCRITLTVRQRQFNEIHNEVEESNLKNF